MKQAKEERLAEQALKKGSKEVTITANWADALLKLPFLSIKYEYAFCNDVEHKGRIRNH